MWGTCCFFHTHSITPEGLWSSYQKCFKPLRFSCDGQPSCFHPITFGVRWLVHHKWLNIIFPKQIGQQWWIVEVRIDWCIGCTRFSLSYRVFPLFAHVLLCTFISFNFAIIIYPTISLLVVFISTLFLLQIYADTINGNICSETFQGFQSLKREFSILRSYICTSKLLPWTNGQFLDIIRLCARAIIRWVVDIFPH